MPFPSWICMVCNFSCFFLLLFLSHLTGTVKSKVVPNVQLFFFLLLRIHILLSLFIHCAYAKQKKRHHHHHDTQTRAQPTNTHNHSSAFILLNEWTWVFQLWKRVWSTCVDRIHLLIKVNIHSLARCQCVTHLKRASTKHRTDRSQQGTATVSHFEFINFVRNNKLFSYGPIFKQ